MEQKREKFYKTFFLVAAIYDLVLGVIFTFFYKFAFNLIGSLEKLPEYGAYISLIGAFLFVIGVAYYLIYRGDLEKNRDLVLVGALYKFSYVSIALFYGIFSKVPHWIFIGLFGVLDLIFLILMLECYLYLRKSVKD